VTARAERIVLASLLGIAIIGVVDHLVGAALGFAAFYLVPVLVASYWGNTAYGFAAAVAATLTWFGADLRATDPTPVWVSIWNATSRLIVFSLVAFLVSRWQRDRGRLAALAARLDLLHQRERELARTDALTGLPNSRAFLEALDTELARAARSGDAVCVGYVDLDDFKHINDVAGHGAGDAALRAIARALRETIRAGDVAARLGGDEFTLLLTRANASIAAQVGERLTARIRGITPAALPAPLGASVGFAVLRRAPATAALALRLADDAMYDAKAAGKGRVIVRDYDSAPPLPHLAMVGVAARKRDRCASEANREVASGHANCSRAR